MLAFKTISRDVSRPSRRKAEFTRDVYEIAPREKKYVLQTDGYDDDEGWALAHKSAKKFDSFIPLLRRRNTEDFIIADTDGKKTRGGRGGMEGRR